MEDDRFGVKIKWIGTEIETELEMEGTFENQELIRALSTNVMSDAPVVQSINITPIDEKPNLRIPMNETSTIHTLTPRNKK